MWSTKKKISFLIFRFKQLVWEWKVICCYEQVSKVSWYLYWIFSDATFHWLDRDSSYQEVSHGGVTLYVKLFPSQLPTVALFQLLPKLDLSFDSNYFRYGNYMSIYSRYFAHYWRYAIHKSYSKFALVCIQYNQRSDVKTYYTLILTTWWSL